MTETPAIVVAGPPVSTITATSGMCHLRTVLVVANPYLASVLGSQSRSAISSRMPLGPVKEKARL